MRHMQPMLSLAKSTAYRATDATAAPASISAQISSHATAALTGT